MRTRQLSRSLPIANVVAMLAVTSTMTACKPAKIKSTQDNSELGQVVAKVDDNVITVGDRVWFRPGGSSGDEGVIEKIEPRTTTR